VKPALAAKASARQQHPLPLSGLVNYASSDCAQLAGLPASQIAATLGWRGCAPGAGGGGAGGGVGKGVGKSVGSAGAHCALEPAHAAFHAAAHRLECTVSAVHVCAHECRAVAGRPVASSPPGTTPSSGASTCC
jgi:hypothetical protein